MATLRITGNGLSIEKYAILAGIPDDRKMIAYQSSSGAVSEFIRRTVNPHNTWRHLKEQFAVRFSDVTDRQMALSLLRNVKTKTRGKYTGIC